MEEKFPRSPSDKVGGIVYFGRMVDKLRQHSTGQLPCVYEPNLGKGFDESCVTFLQVDYRKLAERVKSGGSDEEILDWCFDAGRCPTKEEIFVWNEFMRKRGWNDEISSILERRKNEEGMSARTDIETMFAFIDADEGRPV